MGRQSTELATVEAAATQHAFALLVAGESDSSALEQLRREFPNADASTVLASAGERLARSADCDRRAVIGWALEAYREIYRRALAADELGDASRAVKELVKLARETDARDADDDEKENEDDDAQA